MKHGTLYQVGEFDVILFPDGDHITFGHDPETGAYARWNRTRRNSPQSGRGTGR